MEKTQCGETERNKMREREREKKIGVFEIAFLSSNIHQGLGGRDRYIYRESGQRVKSRER